MLDKLASRLTLITLLLATAAAATAAPEILPAAVGNKWEYETVKLVRAQLTVDGRPMVIMGDASSGSSVYEFASADDAETFGAGALGLSKDEYYEALCEMADQIGGCGPG